MTRKLIGLVSPAGKTNAKIAAEIARQIAQAQVSREGQQAGPARVRHGEDPAGDEPTIPTPRTDGSAERLLIGDADR